MSQRWTIQQLQAVVQQVLAAADYDGQLSGRVRDVPDLRTIRYYTTLGLLDKPAEMRGRRALYSGRHALQLAAIKRLQARGLTLVELQQTLTGADDRQLHRWVGLPGPEWKRVVEAVPSAIGEGPLEVLRSPGSPARPAAHGRERFWADAPGAPSGLVGAQPGSSDAPSGCRARPAVHLSVLPHVQLVIDELSWASLDDAQHAELAKAVAVFAAALSRIGLPGPFPPRESPPASGDGSTPHPREERT